MTLWRNFKNEIRPVLAHRVKHRGAEHYNITFGSRALGGYEVRIGVSDTYLDLYTDKTIVLDGDYSLLPIKYQGKPKTNARGEAMKYLVDCVNEQDNNTLFFLSLPYCETHKLTHGTDITLIHRVTHTDGERMVDGYILKMRNLAKLIVRVTGGNNSGVSIYVNTNGVLKRLDREG